MCSGQKVDAQEQRLRDTCNISGNTEISYQTPFSTILTQSQAPKRKEGDKYENVDD